MTSERDTGQARDVADARVTEAYRDLAGERAPASLNERVLREARAHAGRGYSWWMGWLRPAAWVTTIGLCLAIVLELTTTEVGDIERTAVPPSSVPAPIDAEREADEEHAMQDTLTPGDPLPQRAPARKNQSEDIVVTGSRIETPAAPPQPGERAEALGRAASSTQEPKSSEESSKFEAAEAEMLEDAGDPAATRERPEQVPGVDAERRVDALRTGAAAAADPLLCDDEARSRPESWIECILDIERRGGNADDEREELLARFPDAELPP